MTNVIFSSIQRWLKSVCNCDTTNFRQHNITCINNTIANVTIVVQSYENYTTEIMINLIVDYIQKHNSVVYLHSGWVICLNADCQWKFNINNNSNIHTVMDDSKSMPLIIGLVVGTVFIVIASLICFIVLLKKMNERSRLV